MQEASKKSKQKAKFFGSRNSDFQLKLVELAAVGGD